MIRVSCILILIAWFAPLLADEPAPRFFIERIEVRNAQRLSSDVVIAESRLRAGHEYSEAELRDASTRLSRLPFLLSADFALEKGSERGRYILVITISETRPFFYAIDLRPIFKKDEITRADLSDHTSGADTEGVVGMRFFVGRRGAIHFGIYSQDFQHEVATDYTAFEAGYTQYDLFGTRAFATFNLKSVLPRLDSVERTTSPQLVVGVPLSPNQTLTLAFDDTIFSNGKRTILGQTRKEQHFQRVLSAAWSYNTTNHPFLPTRGTLLQVKPILSWSDIDYSYIGAQSDPPEPEVLSISVHTRSKSIELSAAHYWELSELNSASAGVRGGLGHIDVRDELLGSTSSGGQFAVFWGGLSHSLRDRAHAKDGDSRLELTASALIDSGKEFDESAVADYIQQISVSWVFRNAWGSVRLGVGYAR